MGGRGSSSRFTHDKPKGLEVTYAGETTTYYFDNKDGKNYYIREIGAVPEQTPANLSLDDFRKRAEARGATIRTISQKEYEEKEKSYWDERNNRPDYELGAGVPWGNREYSRQARRNRLATRASRKK